MTGLQEILWLPNIFFVIIGTFQAKPSHSLNFRGPPLISIWPTRSSFRKDTALKGGRDATVVVHIQYTVLILARLFPGRLIIGKRIGTQDAIRYY